MHWPSFLIGAAVMLGVNLAGNALLLWLFCRLADVPKNPEAPNA